MAQSEFSYKKPFNKNERPQDRSQSKNNFSGNSSGGSGPRPQRTGPAAAASAGPAKARPHQRSEHQGPKKDHSAKDAHSKNKFQKNQKPNGAAKQISRPHRPNTENNYRRKNTPSSSGVLGTVKSFFKKLFA